MLVGERNGVGARFKKPDPGEKRRRGSFQKPDPTPFPRPLKKLQRQRIADVLGDQNATPELIVSIIALATNIQGTARTDVKNLVGELMTLDSPRRADLLKAITVEQLASAGLMPDRFRELSARIRGNS